MIKPDSIFRNHAPHYMEHGLQVIPLQSRSKVPCVEKWQEYAEMLIPADVFHKWLERYPSGNIGLVLGGQSGIEVIDIDTDDPKLIEVIESVLPHSPWVRIGAKGAALAYSWSGLRTFRLRDPNGRTIVEMLSAGTQLVLPPSIHPDTRTPYTANTDLATVLHDLQPLPDDIETKLISALRQAGIEVKGRGQVQLALPVSLGGRDTAMTGVAGHYARAAARGELSLNRAIMDMHGWYEAQCEHISGNEIDIDKGIQRLIGYFVDDVYVTDNLPKNWDADLDSVLKQQINEALSDRKAYAWTEFGLRDRLVNVLDGDYRWSFVYDWMVFDGMLWIKDEAMSIRTMVEHAIYEAANDAERIRENTKRKTAIGKARSWQSERTIQNVLELSKHATGGAISPDMFDVDPWLLNTETGTIDLRSGTCRDHNKKDYMLHLAGASFNPDATCPVFERFIERLFDGDAELIEFTQTALGVALVGEQLEKVLIIFHGRGDTGKSVLLTTMEYVFGSYATVVSPSLLMEHRNEPHPERIAKLKGVRLVTTSELSAKKRFDNEETKRLTGGDTLVGRFISANSFSFKPAFTIFMAANDLPMFNGADKAMRDRLRLVPVGTPILKEQQDPALVHKLEQESSGILNWLLEGLAKYREQGLVTPERIRAATNEYADDHDRVGRFFQEWIVDQPGAETTVEEIYLKYVEWCFEEGYQALGKPGLGKEIARMGSYEAFRTRRGAKVLRAWRNLRIRRPEEHISFLDTTMPLVDPRTLNSFLPKKRSSAV